MFEKLKKAVKWLAGLLTVVLAVLVWWWKTRRNKRSEDWRDFIK